MLSPEELEERRHFLGASEAAAIIGLNPYQSAWDVYASKIGIDLDKSAMEERLWFGSEIEHVIARRYEIETGVAVEKAPPRVHPRHPWLRGSPDRLLVDGSKGLEIKTVAGSQEWMWGPAGTAEVPPHVRIQCDILMACHDLPAWDVMALFGTFTSRIYHLQRMDAEYEETLIQALSAFWHDHVLARVEPEIDGSDGAKAWLRAAFPRDTRELRRAGAVEELEAIEDFILAKRLEKEVARQVEKAKNTLARHIGDAGGLICSKGTITFRADRRGIRSFRAKLEGLTDDDE